MLSELTDLDAISIITPNRTHRPLAIQALEAGKHVFCEKPPALNASEVNEMKQAAEQFAKTLMFNFNNRARPESYALRKYIEAGEVGQINSRKPVDSQDRHSRLWRLVYKQGNVWRRSTYRSFAYG